MNKSRISRSEGFLLIVLAGCTDLSQFVLTIVPFGFLFTPIVSIFAWFFFGIWFSHKGVGLFAPSRVTGTLGAMLGEGIPFINAFPWWTFRILVAVKYEWWKEGKV